MPVTRPRFLPPDYTFAQLFTGQNRAAGRDGKTLADLPANRHAAGRYCRVLLLSLLAAGRLEPYAKKPGRAWPDSIALRSVPELV